MWFLCRYRVCVEGYARANVKEGCFRRGGDDEKIRDKFTAGRTLTQKTSSWQLEKAFNILLI